MPTTKGAYQMKTKMIVNPSLYVFVAEIEEAINEGWKVDLENNPPVMAGWMYECGVILEDEEESSDSVKPKMTRAEALAAARKAKAEKKAA
jgi:hypothetical protein